MSTTYLNIIEKFGFPIMCLIVVAGFLGWLIRYIITTNAIREKQLQDIVQNDLVFLNDGHQKTSTTLDEIRKANSEAHKYQREEHNKMIESLININTKLS